jgi:hypothetical protein
MRWGEIASAQPRDIHSTFFPEDTAQVYATWCAAGRRRYDRFSGERGFSTLPTETARVTSDLRVFAARIGAALRPL